MDQRSRLSVMLDGWLSLVLMWPQHFCFPLPVSQHCPRDLLLLQEFKNESLVIKILCFFLMDFVC
jgi:hypothetical protein